MATRHAAHLSQAWKERKMTEQLRRLAPIEDRGTISRSTVIETAVRLALADAQANGRQSAIYRAMVTSP